MATEVDELITKLSYADNSKTLEEAEKRVDDLSKSNEVAANTTDKLSDEQLKLAQQLQVSKERTDRLKTEQKQLRDEMRASAGGTQKQKDKLKQLNREIEGSTLKTKKLTTQSKRLGLEKRKVSSDSRKLTKDQRRLSAAVKKTTREVKKETGALGKFGSRVATIVSGLAIRDVGRDIIHIFTQAAAAIAGLVPEFTAVADEIGKTAKALGIDPETLQRLEFAGARSGVKDMSKALKTFTKNFEDARQKGTGPLADAFDEMNLKISDFDELGTEEKIKRLADEMNKVEDPTVRSGLAMSLFGSKSKEMAVFLAEGSEGIQELGDRAEELGGVIDSSAVAAAERMADQFLDVETFAKGLKVELATGLAPFVEQATQGILAWVTANRDLIDQGLEAVVSGLSRVFQVVSDVLAGLPVDKLIKLFTDFVSIMSALAEQMGEAAQDTGGMFSIVIDLLGAFLSLTVAALDLIGTFGEMTDGLPIFPMLNLLLFVLKLAIDLFIWMVGILTDVVTALKPVTDAIRDFVSTVVDAINPIDDLADALGFGSAGALEMARSTAALNSELDGTASAAMGAVAALQALADAQNQKEKDAAEKASGKGKAKAKGQEGARVLRDKQNQANRTLGNPKKVSITRLEQMSNDFDLTEKQRSQARKLAAQKKKKGGKGGKQDSTLTAQIEKQIEKLAQDAGTRAAARARLSGQTDSAAIDKIERTERSEVSERLTTRFRSTGELPAGIRSDISQLARTPGVEAAGGRVAPPVISINTEKNDFDIDITVEVETGADPNRIASAVANAIKTIGPRDIKIAINNGQTQERR